MKNIAQNIKKARLNSGKTQSEVGEIMGVHYTSISRWEKTGNIALKDAICFASIVGINACDLLKGVEI